MFPIVSRARERPVDRSAGSIELTADRISAEAGDDALGRRAREGP